MTVHEVMRAYRFALDPNPAQVEHFKRHAGAQRWAFNHALGRKVAAHQAWRAQVDELVATGINEQQARKQVKVPVPGFVAVAADWRAVRGDSRADADGVSPWWHEVSSYAFSAGFRNADAAWKNWLDSLSGKRAGGSVGYPRFKAKGRVRDCFALYHDVKKPTIRLDGYRRLLIPRVGSVRLHDSAKRLSRLVERGSARVQSVTVSRGGDRWYASVMVALTPEAMRQREAVARGRQGMSKALQRSRPVVGLEWGVRTLAVLSDGERFENPRHLKAASRRLRKMAQDVSRKPFLRGQQSSANRVKAVRRLAKAHHEVALVRAQAQHQITARLALSYPCIAVRDLDVKGMTKSAGGSRQEPGRDVKIKARFNRAILDTAPYQLRQQLAYKTAQFGTEFRVAPKDLPSSQTCSRCGWRDPSIPLSQVVFRCGNVACGARIDREVNAARNIRNCAVPVASDSGETLNACGDGVGPPVIRGLPSVKQEGQPVKGRPSRGSDPPVFLPIGSG